MGVFGNINGVFSALGKPYIKLEFDDNAELLSFQKRMNEGGEAAELEYKDGEFAPVENLSGYGDKYTVIDNRKRAKKEPGELVANKNLSFRKKGKAAENYNKDAYDDSKYKRVVIVTNLDGLYIEFYIFKAITKATENTKSEPGYSIKQGADGKYYKGTPDREIVKANIKDLYNIVDYIPSKKEAYVTNEIYQKYYNNALNKFFDELKRTIKYYEDELKKEKNNIYKYTSNKFVQQYESYLKEAQKVYNYNVAFYGYKGLGAPGDVYIVTDTRKNPRKELDETAAFKKLNVEKYTALQRRLIELENNKNQYAKADREQQALIFDGIGKTANNLLYNDNSIIDCRGFKPTYKILPSYDSFFDVAKNKNTFAGFGLDDTKKLIADTCRKHYKDCEKIAKHLKGDCLIQSAFNLWHWLRHNIRYEYDREGREEVRAPLRTWQDRERGVDCDCLSVFAWCVLKCMGYNPAFELAAFKNRENFSHIYINCDGIIVDRVWFIFNSRPPLVTKTEIYKVNLQDLGKLF